MLLLEKVSRVAHVEEERGHREVEEEGTNVQEAMCPLGAINLMQLLEHNLHLLPIGGAHRDEVKTLDI